MVRTSFWFYSNQGRGIIFQLVHTKCPSSNGGNVGFFRSFLIKPQEHKMFELMIIKITVFSTVMFLIVCQSTDYDLSDIVSNNNGTLTINRALLAQILSNSKTEFPAKNTNEKVMSKEKKIKFGKEKQSLVSKSIVPIPIPPTTPVPLDLFGPRGLSSQLLQDPRTRLLLSRLNFLSPLISSTLFDSLGGQQNIRNPRQLPFAGGNNLLNALIPPVGQQAGSNRGTV